MNKEKIVKAQERSGLTQEEYCRARGISAKTFSRWKSELKRKEEKTGDFYPITVSSEKTTKIEIEFKSGIKIRVPENINISILKSLRQAYEI